MFTSPDNHQHKAPQAVLDHTTSSQNEEHAKSDLWNICENPERPMGTVKVFFYQHVTNEPTAPPTFYLSR